MTREKIDTNRLYPAVLRVMQSRGLLLGSYDSQSKPNLMTIGWGSMGSIWGEPVWIVLVRPSRYTYRCIEHTGCFSVNVPGADLNLACATCGSRSGRDVEKFEACDLTARKGQSVLAPVVAQCPLVYECQVIHASDIDPAKMDGRIVSGAYRDGDYHRMYFGKILDTGADPMVEDLLASDH
jgi:flavin reductase (DIM6/NTAB) family NADH-FMN oxidoreductase RutF